MNIFIAGGGRVGFHLARMLSAERQSVTVIEADQDRVEQIDYALDVSTAKGDGSSVLLLQSIGVSSAELFVASMGSDEHNLIAAATAKGLGAKTVVARVDNPMYIESNILYETVLNVDYILSPDALAALEIASYIAHPGILSSQSFGRGLVQMRQVKVDRLPDGVARPLREIVPPGSGVLLGVIERNGKTAIPHGDAMVEIGDVITLLGHREKLAPIQQLFHTPEARLDRVVILGGSTVGQRVAAAIESKVASVKLFERREDRASLIAGRLNKTNVICRDGASRATMDQEHLDQADVFVAATNDDERNIMSSVLAKEVGVKNVIAIVHQPDFAPLVKRLGIDLAVTPRHSIANRILKLVHLGKVTSLAVLGEGQVEVLEFPVGDNSPVLGRQLKDVSSKFPRGALIGSILRGNNVFVPGGEDEIHAGDSVILIASSEALEPARRLLQKQ